MDWMIGVIDTLYTALGTPRNYSAIADLHTLQCTVTHTHTHTSVLSLLSVTLSTGCYLVTDFNTGTITFSLNHILQI
jgi:hypothetical protein